MGREEIENLITENLVGHFWTHIEDLVKDIENLGTEFGRLFIVEEIYDEYISFEDEESEVGIILYLGHANNTMWIDLITDF